MWLHPAYKFIDHHVAPKDCEKGKAHHVTQDENISVSEKCEYICHLKE